jgi:uncharacterized protein YbjT (DUF2867 family)
MKSIAIAGATGLTGRLCLEALLAHPQVGSVTALGRRATGLAHPKLREVGLANGRPAEPVAADAFICCLGTTIKKAGSQAAFVAIDRDLPLSLARALKEGGCEVAALVSAMGADSTSSIFYNRTKGETEEGLKALGLRSLTILRPSIIDGPRGESRPGERLALRAMNALSFLMQGPLAPYRPIHARHIAGALVRAVLATQPGVQTLLSNKIEAPHQAVGA